MEKIAQNSSFLAAMLSHSRMACLSLLLCLSLPIFAQNILKHKVEKNESIFSISQKYGISMAELRNANPKMNNPNYILQEGSIINVPAKSNVAQHNTPAAAQHNTPAAAQPNTPASAIDNNVTIGVMLPLHNINGDGTRMLEYYRGMLLAVRTLKEKGYNVTVNAWNVAENDNIINTLADPKAAKCNIIFGPLYTTQVQSLARFCTMHNIQMVIPFSINGNDVESCPQIHQVYQSPAEVNSASIDHYMSQFPDCHTVFIDCNDASSKKGDFTYGLRTALIERNRPYNITNLTSADDLFLRAFSTTKRNVVVLNTGRSPELGKVFQRLDALRLKHPEMKFSMFGYNEWLMYTKIYQEKFRIYDAYIPSLYDYNGDSADIKRIEQLYRTYYKADMQQWLPRFAITGYDHLMFFAEGYARHGAQFHGTAGQRDYNALQTPLKFERIAGGGYKNHNFMLIHYK